MPVADSAASYLALSDRLPEAARVEDDLRPGGAGPRVQLTDFRDLFHAHYASVWRLLRRFGIHPAQLDDAAQEVFWIAARRLSDIEQGKEHAFLYGVAVRIASNTLRRQKTALPLSEPQDLSQLSDQEPSPEQRLEQRQARQLLDTVLDRMPLELRRVFVLYELERVAVRDIAELEDIPVGTASSRLRRAREEFSAIAKRVRTTLATRVGSF